VKKKSRDLLGCGFGWLFKGALCISMLDHKISETTYDLFRVVQQHGVGLVVGCRRVDSAEFTPPAAGLA
jgi:hypothetical protein